ncbi:hypothetical protein BDR04DRAFT_1158082 [Suillus decipiens]|nr:hypothetical protein BDR04DRAFT_1158082 [Suillus decipiens]
MHPPNALYCDMEFQPSHTHHPFLYSAVPPHLQPSSKPLIPLSKAVSDEELKQPYLLAAPTKAPKYPSAPTVQPQKPPLNKKTKAGGKGKAPTKPEPNISLSVSKAPKKG